MLKDIGLGASMYLLQLKTFAYLFLILSIINIPILIIFSSGNGIKESNLSGINYILNSLSLGNIGESGPECKLVDLATNPSDIELNCRSGIMTRFESIGMSKNQV